MYIYIYVYIYREYEYPKFAPFIAPSIHHWIDRLINSTITIISSMIILWNRKIFSYSDCFIIMKITF